MITYEFLYGIPPFHAETPEKVFENILSGRIDRHEEYIGLSPEALDFMKRWPNIDSSWRLGANGAAEVKAHPFFNGVDIRKKILGYLALPSPYSGPSHLGHYPSI